MKPRFLLIVFAVVLAAISTSWGTPPGVGIVKSVAGKVVIERNGGSILPAPNQRLYLRDVVRTGADGKAGLILDDDTVITLGPKSSITIEDFAFSPRERKLSLVARVLHGTVSFLSGRIAKLAPSLVHIMTPHGTVGVRGTHVIVRVD